MLLGTQTKSIAGRIGVIGLVSLAAFSLSGCEDRTMPEPVDNAPTFSPDPLMTDLPEDEISEEAGEGAEEVNQEEVMEEPAEETPSTENGAVEEDPADTFSPE